MLLMLELLSLFLVLRGPTCMEVFGFPQSHPHHLPTRMADGLNFASPPPPRYLFPPRKRQEFDLGSGGRDQ